MVRATEREADTRRVGCLSPVTGLRQADWVYDVIVVGARVAGSPTAMLLARQGHRVLLVDRAEFPSDVISTHLLHVPAVAILRRWGLLDRVLESAPPPYEYFRMDFGA